MMCRKLLLKVGMPALLLLLPSSLLARFSLLDFSKLYALEGTWRKPQQTGTLFEVWERKNDTLLIGRTFTVTGKDTSADEETVSLTFREGSIDYTPTVRKQNGGKPVSFALKTISDSGFVFENPEHDFPQRIKYRPSGDSLFASISGITSRGFREVKYDYVWAFRQTALAAMNYFHGSWKLNLWMATSHRQDPADISATWVVQPSLDQAFGISGYVLLPNGRKNTAELVAFDPFQRIFTRTIAGNDSSFYQFRSKGWANGSLIWTGTQSVSGAVTPMREEITKINDYLFKVRYFAYTGDRWKLQAVEELSRIKAAK